MVPESVQYDFLVNEAIWEYFVNACLWAAVHLHEDQDQIQRALRNMDVEEIRPTVAPTQNPDHQLATERIVRSVWVAEPGQKPVEVVYFVARRHLQTIYDEGVRMLGFCAGSLWKVSI